MKNILLTIALALLLTSCADSDDATEDCLNPSSDCYVTTTTTDDATTEPPPTTPEQPPPDPEPDDPPAIVEPAPQPDTTPPVEPEPEIETTIQVTDTGPTFTPLFIIQIGNEIYLDDTITREFITTGQIKKAGPDLWLINNQLFSIDTTADAITLEPTPTQAHATATALYTCTEIDPAQAQATGAQAKYYTEFYIDTTGTGLDLISTGNWITNQHRCFDIISAAGYVFAITETGALIQIDGPATTPLYVLNGEFVTHNLDPENNRIDFNDSTESYVMNHLTAANQWIASDGAYYSETGYIWSPVSGLQELATALSDFNEDPRPIALLFGQSPTLISAGTRGGLIYWIEGNTGWLIEYDPIFDTITKPHRLYFGDGDRATGTEHRDTLRPVVIDQYIYFSIGVALDGTGGILKRIDLDTGFFDDVYSGQATIFLID